MMDSENEKERKNGRQRERKDEQEKPTIRIPKLMKEEQWNKWEEERKKKMIDRKKKGYLSSGD